MGSIVVTPDLGLRTIRSHEIHPQIPILYNPDSGEYEFARSAGQNLLGVANFIWDTGTLTWIKDTGGGGGGGGAVTIADGADVNSGATTDPAVLTDSNGTLSAKLRGLVTILSDIWDNAGNRIRVDGSSVTQPTSGNWLTDTQLRASPVPVLTTFADVISAPNSTTVPLGAGATFTGTFVEVLGYSNISVIVFADQGSAVDGLKLESSSDGINVDDSDSFTISAGVGKQFSFGAASRYIRVRYVNGGIAQGTFRLQTILHQQAPKSSSHRINQSIVNEDDAELVKAVITASTGSGFVNIDATNSSPAANAFGLIVRPLQSNVVSSLNSTTALLGIGAVFTGAFEDVLEFADVVISIFSNQSSATDGLRLELSSDGVNADEFDAYTFIGGTGNGKQYSVGLTARYFRVRYTNGGVAQTVFRLQVVYKRTRGKPSSHRIDDIPITQDDAELVKAVLAAKRPDNTYVNITATTAGNLKVSVEEFDSAANFTKIEDTPHVDGAIGVLNLGVRNDIGTSLSGSDLDYSVHQMDGFGALRVTTRSPLVAAAPTSASVGVVSAQILATNSSRRGLVLTNLSNATISVGFGSAAVLNAGVTLMPGGTFVMDSFMFSRAAVNTIASAAASTLAIQEYT